MSSPYETRKPPPELRRASLRWVIAVLVLIAVGVILQTAFPDESWFRPARTVVAILTGAVLIGSLMNTVKVHRHMTKNDGY